MATDPLDRIALVLTAGGAGFCFGEWLAPASRDVQWETLITGIFAIAAAAWTVRATLKIDREQDRRHRQVIDLSLRGDTLRIGRAAYPYPDRLASWATFAYELLSRIVNDDKDPTASDLAELSAIVDQIGSLLTKNDLSEARDLFDPVLASSYSDALHDSRLLGAFIANVQRSFSSEMTSFDYRRRMMLNIKDELLRLIQHGSLVAEGLRALGVRYNAVVDLDFQRARESDV